MLLQIVILIIVKKIEMVSSFIYSQPYAHMESRPLDYVIHRIVGVILEMFWDTIVLGSRLYNIRGYLNMIVCYTDDA